MQKLHDERTCNHNAINEVIIPRTLKDALGTHAALIGQETLQLTVHVSDIYHSVMEVPLITITGLF